MDVVGLEPFDPKRSVQLMPLLHKDLVVITHDHKLLLKPLDLKG